MSLDSVPAHQVGYSQIQHNKRRHLVGDTFSPRDLRMHESQCASTYESSQRQPFYHRLSVHIISSKTYIYTSLNSSNIESFISHLYWSMYWHTHYPFCISTAGITLFKSMLSNSNYFSMSSPAYNYLPILLLARHSLVFWVDYISMIFVGFRAASISSLKSVSVHTTFETYREAEHHIYVSKECPQSTHLKILGAQSPLNVPLCATHCH